MAYLAQSEIEKQNQNQQGQQPILSTPSGVVAPGAPTAPSNSKQPSRSGAYTNLQSYLGANQEQAADLGNKVGTNIVNAGNEARQNITDASNAFQSKVDEGTLSGLSGAKDEAQGIVNKAGSLNAGGTLSDEDKNRFNEIQKASYSGPNNLTDVSDAYNKAQTSVKKASDYTDLSKTDSGRYTLLNQMFDNNRYTSGQQSLDNLLLSGSDSGKQALENARSSVSDVSGLFDTANTNAASLASQRKTDVANTAQAAQDAAINSYQNLLNQITQGVANLKNTGQAQYDSFKNDIKDRALSADTLAALGLDSGSRIYKSDLNQYLNEFNPSAITVQNYANADQYARENALANLAGLNSQLYDSSQAGTAKGATFNTDKLNADLAAQADTYNQAYSTKRSGILNNNYLLNPNYPDGYAGLIPGAYTSRRDLNSATPQELESYWLPLFQYADAQARAAGQANGPGDNLLHPGQGNSLYSIAYTGIAKSLQDWKNSLGYNNILSKLS